MLCLSKFFRHALAGLAATCCFVVSIPASGQTITHVPLYTFEGSSTDIFFRRSVSGAGDVNNDGYADVIIGASGDDHNGIDSGSARVLSGQDGSTLYTFYGDSAGDRFGRSVNGAGDVNNDGYADVIIGGFYNDGFRVLSGQDGSTLYSGNGRSSGAGDVNNDGFADVIIGVIDDDHNGIFSGSARVLSGQDGSTLYTFYGDRRDFFGSWVSGAGDVNNDGFADVIVGASIALTVVGVTVYEHRRGYARVLSGQDGSTLYTFDGEEAGDNYGRYVSGAGDVNNDGHADVIVFADGGDVDYGEGHPFSRVLSGQDGSILYSFDAVRHDSHAADARGVGDLNNDGYADLSVGAGEVEGRNSVGARVLSGQDGSILFEFARGSVSGAGDVNGDGLDDFIVSDSGISRVFVSQISVFVLGDVNGDDVMNFSDIPSFISVLISGDFLAEADINGDGAVDFADIPFFIDLLISQ